MRGAREEVKALERDLKRAAEELRDSCARLTEASLALSAAAADNAEKDAVVKALHAKVAELEEKAAANAARSRDELAQMAKANAAEAEKNAKLTKAMAAAKFAAAHKHQQHKDEKGRLVAQVDAAKTAADAERAAAKQVSLFKSLQHCSGDSTDESGFFIHTIAG